MKAEWEKALEESTKRYEQANEDRKTLKPKDWVTYGAMPDAHMGQIEEVDHKSNTCTIRHSEKQTSFHDYYWTLHPYVNKRESFLEAAGIYYNHLRQGDMWGGGMNFDDFRFIMGQDWPSFVHELTWEAIRPWLK